MCWCYNYYKVYVLQKTTKTSQKPVKPETYIQSVKRQLSEKFETENMSELIGDHAADVKVSNQELITNYLYAVAYRG